MMTAIGEDGIAMAFSPGAYVEWDYLPPACGVARRTISRIVDGTIYVVCLRRRRNGDIVSSEGWFEPEEAHRLRLVGVPRWSGSIIDEHW